MLKQVMSGFWELLEGVSAGKIKMKYKNVIKEGKDEFSTKRLHEKFNREGKDVAGERPWQWLRARYWEEVPERIVFVAQEGALSTRLFFASIQLRGRGYRL